MAVLYSYQKYKDVYTITNTDPTLLLSYSVKRVTCDSTVEVALVNLLPGKTATLSLYVDGKYTITFYNQNEQAPIVTIKEFKQTLVSLISSMESIVCGCTSCKGCEDCNPCEDYLAGLMKAFGYNAVMAPLYDSTTATIASSLLCMFTDELLCAINKEFVYGNPDVKQLIMTILGQYYGAFYTKDFSLANDDEEREYINTKYKYAKIIKCLNKKGIDPTP